MSKLRVEPGELDLDRVQAVIEAGRQALANGDPVRASQSLRSGLGLWRGPPLADFTYEAFALPRRRGSRGGRPS